MYERIIEIIVYLIAQLQDKRSINDISLDELNDQGYTATEISTAFSWLIDRMEFGDQAVEHDEIAQSESFRVLHDAEAEVITPDAFGYLIQMQQLGLITNEHLEMVLERSMLLGGRKVSDSELKSIIASVIFNSDSMNASGSRMLLNGTDTIH